MYFSMSDSGSEYKHQKRSDVWNYFTILTNEKEKAKCNLCSMMYSYKGTASNLKKHLLSKHPTVIVKPSIFKRMSKTAEPPENIESGDEGKVSKRQKFKLLAGNSKILT